MVNEADEPDGADVRRSALARWAAELDDVGAFGRADVGGALYRPLLRPTTAERDRRLVVDLTPSSTIDAAAIRMLLDGRTIRLSHLTPPDHLRRLARRVGSLDAIAGDILDDHGLATLQMTLGAASWTGPDGALGAPVLLAPVRIARRDGAANDLDVTVTGPWGLNPLLVDHFATLGAEVDPDDVMRADRSHGDSLERFAEVTAAVPGLRVAQRVELVVASLAGRLSADFLRADAAVAGHPVVAALAGDASAVRTVADAGDHDAGGATDSLVVLDADAAQRAAIARVSAGDPVVVVHAPPGTGTTQTIANLVAVTAGAGRSTLFVASRPQAIRDVIERLGTVGLDHLVEHVDHAAPGLVPRSAALAPVRSDEGDAIEPPDREPGRRDRADPREAGAARRLAHELGAALDGHVDALHRHRDAFGASVYELIELSLGAGAHDLSIDAVHGADVEMIDRARLDELGSMLAEWIELGGIALERRTSPWASSAGRLASSTDAERAVDVARRLAFESAPQAESALRGALDLLDVAPPTSVTAAAAAVVAARELAAAADDDPVVPRALLTIDRRQLEQLDLDLHPAGRGRVRRRPSRDARRRADAAASRLVGLLGVETPSAGWPAAVADARRRLDAWAAVGGGSIPEPSASASIEAAVRAIADLVDDLAALSAVLDGVDASLTPAAIVERSAELVADAATALAVPRLHELSATLRAAGLHDVLAQVARHSLAAESARAAVRAAWAAAALRSIRADDPSIGAFDRDAHETAIAAFGAADRTALAAAVAAAAPVAARCHATSPLLAWRLAGRASPPYDVVVVDDATRLPVALGVPAIALGRQVIAFGDPLQLPRSATAPAGVASTSLFEALHATVGPAGAVVLDHHRRNRHEQPFAVAGRHPSLYADGVTILPAADTAASVAHVRATRATDDAELHAVIEVVLEHVASRPGESLAIVAVDPDHAVELREAIRRARGEHGPLDDHCARHAAGAPLVVVPIERAHGVVRDHVVVTFGARPSRPGQRVRGIDRLLDDGVSLLGVALSRGCATTTIVTSFDADDLGELKGTAVAMLADVLRAAASGDWPTRPIALDLLELDVAAALAARDVAVVAHGGGAGDTLRLAAVHPDHPERGVLAIEVDGAAWAARRGARDRERLRDEHLERLGWDVQRVWALAWHLDRDAEADRLATAWRERLRTV